MIDVSTNNNLPTPIPYWTKVLQPNPTVSWLHHYLPTLNQHSHAIWVYITNVLIEGPSWSTLCPCGKRRFQKSADLVSSFRCSKYLPKNWFINLYFLVMSTWNILFEKIMIIPFISGRFGIGHIYWTGCDRCLL